MQLHLYGVFESRLSLREEPFKGLHVCFLSYLGKATHGDDVTIPTESYVEFTSPLAVNEGVLDDTAFPSWRRDGKGITYASNKAENFDIWVHLLGAEIVKPYG